jgi:hypothetical protein
MLCSENVTRRLVGLTFSGEATGCRFGGDRFRGVGVDSTVSFGFGAVFLVGDRLRGCAAAVACCGGARRLRDSAWLLIVFVMSPRTRRTGGPACFTEGTACFTGGTACFTGGTACFGCAFALRRGDGCAAGDGVADGAGGGGDGVGCCTGGVAGWHTATTGVDAICATMFSGMFSLLLGFN